MKTFVVLIVGLLGVGISAVHFDKCHDELPHLPTIQPVKLNEILGKWHFIRKGYVAKDHSHATNNVQKHECMATTLLKDPNGGPDTINYVTGFRDSNHAISHSATLNLTPVGTGLYDNNFSFSHKVEMPGTGEAKEFSYQLKMVESDEGKNWSIWISCIEKFGQSLLFWAIESRTPTMDPYLEEMLMEKIHKYGGPASTEQVKLLHPNCDA